MAQASNFSQKDSDVIFLINKRNKIIRFEGFQILGVVDILERNYQYENKRTLWTLSLKNNTVAVVIPKEYLEALFWEKFRTWQDVYNGFNQVTGNVLEHQGILPNQLKEFFGRSYSHLCKHIR